MSDKPLLIGVSARIYYPGTHGALPGVFTKTLHYLEQSVAHWVLSGHAMAVMVPAVTKDSIVLRSDCSPASMAACTRGASFDTSTERTSSFTGAIREACIESLR